MNLRENDDRELASRSKQADGSKRDPRSAILAYGYRNTVTGDEPERDGEATAEASRVSQAGGSESIPARYQEEGAHPTTAESAPQERSSERGWAPPGAAIHQSESVALTLHLHAHPRLRQPVAPEAGEPDPAVARARIEEELGIPELEASLAEYGTPPVAPPAGRINREALERELLDASADIPPWKVRARHSFRTQARLQAAQEAQAEDERLAGEQRQLQASLDERWAELRALRHRAARDAQEWVNQEMARREASRAERQATLNREWQQLKDADPDRVTENLRAVVPADVAIPLGFLTGVAVLVVTCPQRDALIAETEPAFTSDRHRAVRARSERRRNALFLSAIASRVLAAVGRALSATPAVEAVTCVCARAAASSARRWEPIYIGTFERAYAERVLAEGRWSADPEVLAEVVEHADEVELERDEATHELAALDLARDPELAALLDQLDPAIRSDEDAARASDQAAVSAFLGYGESGHDGDDEMTPEHAGEREDDGDIASHRSQETAAARAQAAVRADHEATAPNEATAASSATPPIVASPSEQSAQNGAADRSATGHDGAGQVRDPLPTALKDSDGSVRRAAVQAIGRRDDANDTPLLLQALSDPDDIVRLEAMYALKERLSPDLRRDALIKASGDSDQVVRRKAVEALADLADERDTPVLLEALKDPDDCVRLEAIYALRHRLAPSMRGALVSACGDVNEAVRRKAVEALAELGDERDTPLLLSTLSDSDSSVRLEAIYALERRSALGPPSRVSEPLLAAMKADDATVRQAAVRLFGRLQAPGTAE